FHYLLTLLAEPVDAERDHVPGLEEFGLWFHAQPHAGGRARNYLSSGLHDEILRAAPENVPAIEDHGACVAALAFVAVHVEPHLEILRVLDLVFGHEPRAERTERLAALALRPLSRAFELKNAFGDIVRKTVTGDKVKRLVLRDVARALADHDAELDLPVELARSLRDDGIVIGAADAGRRFVEDDRLDRDRHSGVRGVI